MYVYTFFNNSHTPTYIYTLINKCIFICFKEERIKTRIQNILSAPIGLWGKTNIIQWEIWENLKYVRIKGSSNLHLISIPENGRQLLG